MADWCCIPGLTTGNDDGTSWANAWKTIDRGFAATGQSPAAGDRLIISNENGTIARTTALTNTIWKGTNLAVSTIMVVASDHTTPATLTIDYNGAANNVDGLILTGADYLIIKGLRIYCAGRTGLTGVTTSNSFVKIINCAFENCGASAGSAYGVNTGASGGSLVSAQFINCFFSGNKTAGISAANTFTARSCRFYAETVGIIAVTSNALRIDDCFFYGGGTGISFGTTGIGSTAKNCIFDRQTLGINIPASSVRHRIINCRFTNNTTGATIATNIATEFFGSGWYGNGTKISLGAGAVADLTDDTDMATDGYISEAQAIAGNFALLSTAECRWISSEIGKVSNSMGRTAGVSNIPDFPLAVNTAPDDTTDGNAGTMDLPAISSVLTTDTLRGVAGTFDEAARNSLNGTVAGDIRTGKSVKVQDETLTGTAIIETHTADQVLKSAGGNWNDDSLGIGDEGNVKNTVAFGLSQTGTLASGSLVAPDKPTNLTGYAQSSTAIALTWDFTVLAEYFDVYRNNVKVNASPVVADNYTDTGLTANTSYSYKIYAVNDAGSSPASDPVDVITKQSATIETRIERGIKEAIESMTIAGGYYDNWQDSLPGDEGTLEIADYPCAVRISLDTEDNQDANREGADSGTYVNHLNVEIETVNLISETDNPAESIKLAENEMLHDLKRKFGRDYWIVSDADCLSMNYVSYERKTSFTGDIAKPARLKTKWRVEYMQNRLEPTQTL
jgi:hypothetical protein